MAISEQRKKELGALIQARQATPSASGISPDRRKELKAIISKRKAPAPKRTFLKDLSDVGEKRGTQFLKAIDRDVRDKQSFGSTLFQAGGAVLGGAADVLKAGAGAAFRALPDAIEDPIRRAGTKVVETALKTPSIKKGETLGDNLVGLTQDLERLKQEKPVLGANIDAALSGIDFLLSTAGVNQALQAPRQVLGATKKLTSLSVQKGKEISKRTFDTALSVPERLRNVRNAIGRADEVAAVPKPSGTKFLEAQAPSFIENPAVSGAIDDIKIMIGLPESTPAVDLTFRAVKPRLSKKTNLRRIKNQMELANQSIVENGFKPASIREYADAVFETKKKVWGEIQGKLELGAAAGEEVDLVPIAMKILDRAEDPALLRTNPQAAKQLTKIAEDLVKQGDKVGVLEAERIKQLLNAELDNAFGAIDLSQQAKEAKKLITREIGVQLDKKLSSLPAEFKDLKIRYGSLSAIEEDILKRAIVFERRNPEGLADILTKTEAAAEIAFGGTKGRLKGIARLTIGRQLKKANDADELVKRAFEKLGVKPQPQ